MYFTDFQKQVYGILSTSSSSNSSSNQSFNSTFGSIISSDSFVLDLSSNEENSSIDNVKF